MTNPNSPITLMPGSYRLFTSKKLQTPDIILGLKDQKDFLERKNSLHIYPNPSSGGFHIEFNTRDKKNIQMDIYDLSGRKIKSLFNGSYKGYLNLYWNGCDDAGKALPEGMYFLRTRNGQQSRVDKLVKQ